MRRVTKCSHLGIPGTRNLCTPDIYHIIFYVLFSSFACLATRLDNLLYNINLYSQFKMNDRSATPLQMCYLFLHEVLYCVSV